MCLFFFFKASLILLCTIDLFFFSHYLKEQAQSKDVENLVSFC